MGTPYPPGFTELDFSNDFKNQIPPLWLPPQKIALFPDIYYPRLLFRRKTITTVFQFLQNLNSIYSHSSGTKAAQLTGNFGLRSSTTARAYS